MKARFLSIIILAVFWVGSMLARVFLLAATTGIGKDKGYCGSLCGADRRTVASGRLPADGCL